jgi:small nuclear ribonucleoprotein (snRNP)-like protein
MLRSLSGFVQHTTGRKVVIEFKDESAAEGKIESCDESMNITLSDVKYFKRRQKTGTPLQLDTFFAHGRFIRFIHFDFDNNNSIQSLINRTSKEEEKPRTRKNNQQNFILEIIFFSLSGRVFGSQTKLPNFFGHIKIQKRKTWRKF